MKMTQLNTLGFFIFLFLTACYGTVGGNFDSSQITIGSFSELLNSGVQPFQIISDDQDYDNDTRTDRYYLISWADVAGVGWPVDGNTGNPLDEDEDRVVVYPTQDFIYVVEALDINGCESREEIEVFVDTCASDIFDISKNNIQIYPNPASEELFINLNSISFCNIEIIDILGRLLIRQEHVNNSLSIKTIEFSKGTYFIRI